MADLNNVFDVAARAMSAQMVRMNTVASNLANAGSIAASEVEAFHPLRPIFRTEYSDALGDGLSTTVVEDVVTLDRPASRIYQPDHPSADKDGFVYRSAVNTDEEMVEMLDASRQYQNTLEAVSTLRALMARTVSMGQ
jgi:flagellar basal-body rod protein FlgC